MNCTAILLHAVSRKYARYVLADLEEEYQLRGSRAWYWAQVARSLAPLARMELRSAKWHVPLAAVALSALAPPIVLDALWSLVLSQVPLKAGLTRGGEFAALELVVCTWLSFWAGFACTRRALAAAACAMLLLSALARAASQGILPGWFTEASVAATVPALVLGSMIGGKREVA